MWKNRNLRSLIEVGWTKYRFRDFTTTPLPIPKNFLVVYLLNLRSESLVSYDPHFPGNDGTNKCRDIYLVGAVHAVPTISKAEWVESEEAKSPPTAQFGKRPILKILIWRAGSEES